MQRSPEVGGSTVKEPSPQDGRIARFGTAEPRPCTGRSSEVSGLRVHHRTPPLLRLATEWRSLPQRCSAKPGVRNAPPFGAAIWQALSIHRDCGPADLLGECWSRNTNAGWTCRKALTHPAQRQKRECCR